MTEDQKNLILEAQRMISDVYYKLEINARKLTRDQICSILRRADDKLCRARSLDRAKTPGANTASTQEPIGEPHTAPR